MTVNRNVITVVFNGDTTVGAGTESADDVVISGSLNSIDVFVQDFGVGGHNGGRELGSDTYFYFLI